MNYFRPFSALLLLVLTLAGCGGLERDPLSPQQVAAVAFAPEEPPSITLVSVINNRSGAGAHSALIVSGSHRVIFDPAGPFRNIAIYEYGDVLYGITDRYVAAYKSAYSRRTHHVVTQKLDVPPETAERALRLVMNRGTVPSAFCAQSTSTILSQLPGFQNIDVTFYPQNLMQQFAQYPGVVSDRYFEDDAGHVVDGIEAAMRQVQDDG